MNTRYIYGFVIGSLLALLVLFESCTKKNDFIGRDNFIASFKLKKGSTTFTAAITDSTIVIKAPQGFSLDSAQAAIALSENASIYPNPATITDWNDESQFVVSSYDGIKKIFRYTVQRNDISLDNSVVLSTQADVDAFAATGATEITGNLIIGSTGGTDSITNLNGLYKLRKVGYSLIIYPTFSASEIIGLDNLTSVGGDLKIEAVNSLIMVVLPSLQTVKNISIGNTLTENVQLPKLTNVTQNLSITGPLNVLSLPNLQQVGGTTTFVADNSQGSSLIPVIAFPALTTAGDILITNFNQTTKLDFPVLTSSGALNLSNLGALYDLSCPKLKKTTGLITIPSPKLTFVSFPALTQAGGLNIDSKTVNAVEFPVLKTIGDLSLRSAAINGVKDFPALTTVTGQLLLADLARPVSQIDVRGLTIAHLNIQVSGGITLLGDDVFHGILTIAGNSPAFPALQGFSEVDSLDFGDYLSSITDLQVKGIRKINKGFSIPGNSMQHFTLPDLQEVGGSIYLSQLNSLSTHAFTAAALKKVGGDLQIATGYDDQSLTSLSFPVLERIGGQLRLYAEYAPWDPNTMLTNLDGFAALKSVGSVSISDQTALTSYAGLQNALPSINALTWNVSGNAYNPSYGDLQDGKWTKP